MIHERVIFECICVYSDFFAKSGRIWGVILGCKCLKRGFTLGSK